MEIVKVTPVNRRRKTELTLEMSAAEADLFLQALHEGKLAELGIESEGVSIQPSEDRPSHSGRLKHQAHRKDAGKPRTQQ